jgi:hypothetical protein
MATDFETRLNREMAEVEDRRAKLYGELARLEGHLTGLQRALVFYKQDATAPVSGGRYAEGRGSRLPDPARSPAWAFVLMDLESAPSGGFSVDDIEARAANAGHSIARNTLLANLSVASKEGIVERVRVGHYRRIRQDDIGSTSAPSRANTGVEADEEQAPQPTFGEVS